MQKSKDPCWVKYVNRTQYSINIGPHSTLEYKLLTEFSSIVSMYRGLKSLESQMRLLQMSLQKKR